MNSIFHQCLARSASKDEFLEKVISYIDHFLQSLISPQKLLYLAFDGVPPLAKIKDQAVRRYTYSKSKTSALLDANSLTPGTKMMKDLSFTIQNYISQTLKKRLPELDVIVSDSSQPGEGEHKIVSHLRGSYKTDEALDIVIFAVDADLILLCLSLTHKNIKLVREANWNKPNLDHDKIFQALRISKLKDDLLVDYSANLKEVIGYRQILLDIVLLFAMVGNDFMPVPGEFELDSQSMVNLLEKLQIYHQTNQSGLVEENGKVRTKDFNDFLHILEDLDFKDFKKNNKIKKSLIASKVLELQLAGLSLSERKGMTTDAVKATELDIFKQWRYKNYYKQLGSKFEDNGRFFQAYIEGLQWLLFYYFDECPSWTWIYEYPIAPHFSDLAIGLTHCDFKFEKGEPMKPLHQLALVLPRKSRMLLPEKYRESEGYDEFSSLLRNSEDLSLTRITDMLQYFEIQLDSNVSKVN